MTIWLVDGSVDDLVRIDLEIGGRLDVPPNKDNELYQVGALSFHYRTTPIVTRSSDGSFNIGEVYGQVNRPRHCFRDRDGTFQEFEYWLIEVCDRVKEEYRDIVFYHELRELEALVEGIKQPEAHEVAVRKTDEYLERHLGAEGKKHFEEYIEQLGIEKISRG